MEQEFRFCFTRTGTFLVWKFLLLLMPIIAPMSEHARLFAGAHFNMSAHIGGGGGGALRRPEQALIKVSVFTYLF
jgi:hypothetical protein